MELKYGTPEFDFKRFLGDSDIYPRLRTMNWQSEILILPPVWVGLDQGTQTATQSFCFNWSLEGTRNLCLNR